jgi:hypothetical protein
MSEVDMRVRRLLLLALGTLAFSSLANAQNQNKPGVVIVPDGGARGPMESIFIPPKPGAPFTLMLAAEWSRPLNNGGSYTLANQRRVVRDSRGRIYQERWILVPKGGAIKSTMNVFQITDPEQHTWYNCETTAKVCELLTYHLTTENTYLPPIGKTGPLPDGRGSQQHEDLGPGNTEGVETRGYRETQTLNPGVMGNDAPMVTVREFWYSQELGINLVSMVDSPLSGKQMFTAKDLTLGEPEATLFLVPDDYKVVDHRDE